MFDGILSAVQAYEQFQRAINDAIYALLESRTFWQQSTEALARFDACAHPSERIVTLAREVRQLRDHIERNIQLLAVQMLHEGTGLPQPLMRNVNEAARLLDDTALDLRLNCEVA